MNRKFIQTMTVAVLILLPQAAHAMVIKGTIAALNPNTHSITLRQVDAGTQQPVETTLLIHPEVEFKGVKSLSDLKVGDEVSVDTKKNDRTGQLEATKIEAGK